jgi:hypothetical protein
MHVATIVDDASVAHAVVGVVVVDVNVAEYKSMLV